jgi:hypothetical protein
MQGTGQTDPGEHSDLCRSRYLVHHMAHVLVEATPRAASFAPIYGVLGGGIALAGPRNCRAPRAFVQDPRPSFKIPGPRSRSQGQAFAFGDPIGLPLGLAHFGFMCRLWPQQIILVAGKLVLGPQFKFLSTTQPEPGIQSLAPGLSGIYMRHTR